MIFWYTFLQIFTWIHFEQSPGHFTYTYIHTHSHTDIETHTHILNSSYFELKIGDISKTF